MPVTSLEHYIHVTDLFLAATTLRVAATTPVAVWQSLTGAGRSVVYEWLRSGPHGVVTGHRARIKGAHGHSGPRTEAGGADPRPWRKRPAAPPLRFNQGGTMGAVSRVLQLYNRLGECAMHAVRVATVAQQCSLSERTVEAWLAAARASASAFGMMAPALQNDDSFDPVPAPDVELHHATVHALHDLAERFERVAHAHPALLREALEIAVARFNMRRHDVCFRGERDEVAARRGDVPDSVERVS